MVLVSLVLWVAKFYDRTDVCVSKRVRGHLGGRETPRNARHIRFFPEPEPPFQYETWIKRLRLPRRYSKDDVLMTDHAVVPKSNVAALRNFHDRFSGGGMNRPEQELLARTYASAESVFEWGMGSSTLIAAHVGIKRLTAVDSAPTWVDKVRGMLKGRPTYTFRHADIGPVIKFGNPKDQTHKDQWPDYSLQVDREQDPFDVYLVDGRFRVACACRALLHGACGFARVGPRFWSRLVPSALNIGGQSGTSASIGRAASKDDDQRRGHKGCVGTAQI